MKLTPQQRELIDYLAGGEWRCMASAGFFMKDDRTRISELHDIGYVIEGERCTLCPKGKHPSRLFMRRLISFPPLNAYQLFHKQMQEEGTATFKELSLDAKVEGNVAWFLALNR